MKAMQQWFQALSKREQYLIVVGGAFGFVLLFYFLIWVPINADIEASREAIKTEQQLLIFTQQAKERILALRSRAGTAPATVDNIMVEVEHALAEAKLAKYLQKVEQPQPDQVTISLHAVPFDQVIDWLQQFLQHYRVKVVQFQAAQTKEFALVELQFTLQKE